MKEYFDDKLAGIQTNTSDKKTPFISNKANIQSGSTIDISKVKCSLEYSDCVYDGKEKKPAVKVDGLVERKDYIVAYSNNVNPGTAKVTINTKKLKKVGKKAFFRKGGKNISFKVPKSKKKVYKKLLKKAKTKKFVVK